MNGSVAPWRLGKRAAKFAADNLEVAEIIIADPERYRGLMLDWAREILAGTESLAAQWQAEAAA